MLRKLLVQAGIANAEEFSSHSLRRGFANWARLSGWDIRELMDYVGWGDVKIAENLRHEQQKIIKYNHLVANMVILHNVVGMSRALKKLQMRGVVINQEILANLGPYRLEHINRFGDYVLDFRRKVEILNADFRF